jgi:hypothetical protein
MFEQLIAREHTYKRHTLVTGFYKRPTTFANQLLLLEGGPCQPNSKGLFHLGKHRRQEKERLD